MAEPAYDVTRDLAGAGLKSALPVGVTLASTVHAFTLANWVAVVTIVYVVLQTGHLMWRWFREWRGPVTPKPLIFEDDEE